MKDCAQWIDHKDITQLNILDLGCGMGHFGAAAKFLYEDDVYYVGMDISEYAINNSPHKEIISLKQGDITTNELPDGFDLTLVIDILEHIQYSDLEDILNKISQTGTNFIFSIPFLGDPNLEADPTHIIKESKEWWIEELSKWFEIKDAPNNWLFNHQLLVGVKK